MHWKRQRWQKSAALRMREVVINPQFKDVIKITEYWKKIIQIISTNWTNRGKLLESHKLTIFAPKWAQNKVYFTNVQSTIVVVKG